jgi:hypothetical protein
MPFTRFASSILQSNQDVVASDLTVDGTTVTVDETNNRLGVNTATPLGTIGVDGDLYFQPTAISTSHVYTAGSLDVRCTDNMKLGTDDADSVRIGRTNTTAAKVHIRSGSDADLVVTNSKVGIGTETPTQALELDGNIQLSPSAISTAHLYTAGSLDVRATANIKIGTDGADSVKIGRTNSTAVKCHIRSGGDNDLVVSNSMVGIGTDAPDHTLSVAGDIDLTGGFSFDGGTAVTSIDTDLSSVSGSDDTLASAKAIGAQLDTKSPTTGHSSIATVGTITTGVWQGTAIANAYVADLPTSKITSGTFADARISSSSVVAHQGDLTGTGALDSGSITSNFGAINNGASGYTTTGAATVGTVLATQDNNGESLPIVAKNADDTDASNAAVGYGFDLETTAGATVNSAKIVAKKKESFTATASTQDAKLEFYVTKNGTEAKQITLQGGNELRFSNSNSSVTVADSSGDNQAGKNIVIEAGAGTGSGVPGKFEVKVSQPTGTAADVQTHNSAIVADGNGVSIYTGNSLAALANDTGFGEIIYWGTEDGTDGLAAGRLMSLNTSGVWKYADADAVATTNTLLAIALGSAVSDGLLVKGYFKLNSYIEGSFAKGAPCFVSEASGEIDFTAPSAAGDVLRIVGHGTSETNVILFDPSNDYVEL